MRVIGIDPGVTGALAVINGSADGSTLIVEVVHDLPVYIEKTKTGRIKRQIDPVELQNMLEQIGFVDRVICERLNAPPGVASTIAFSLGATLATITTILRLSKTPYKLVSPNVWKRALECPADKETARLFASKIFKDSKHWARKKDHNRAEAALLGAYAVLNG